MSLQWLVGCVSGMIVAAGLAVGIAYASASEKKGKDAACRVSVGFGRMTGGTECYSNRVMVGIRGNYILCADLDVQCN